MDTIFDILGYHLDVYDGGGYLGYIKLEEPDREVLGYSGRKEQYIHGIVTKGKTIRLIDGYFMTECVPLCGKIKTDKVKVLRESLEWRNQVQ
jgi:hypothetical protein